MRRMHKAQKGFALVTSLLLMLLMSVMGIGMTARSNLDTNMSVEYDRSEHIFFAAEAGIEHARRHLENGSSQTPPIYPGNPGSENGLGPIVTTPNRCLADYQDGIASGGMYNTLGNDNGQYAYRFPSLQSDDTMRTDHACIDLDANSNLGQNYRRMDCELDLASEPNSIHKTAEINYFKTYGFSYYIFYEGQSSGSASSSIGGGTIGTSTEYAAGSQASVYYYKVISCGAGFNWDGASIEADLNQIQTIEARIKLEQ